MKEDKDLRKENGYWLQQKEADYQKQEFSEIAAVPLRTYRDRVFRMIFKERKSLLQLYNAMNGTDYEEAEDLVVTTLENAVYLGMKNDVSFLLYDQLNLYEHQSTNNPNMPLRNLFYVSSLYSALTRDENLYGPRVVKIPEARFVVFYNGKEELPERFELKLSDSFATKTEMPALELRTEVWNINAGCNKVLMERCKLLYDYAVFVDKVRKYGENQLFSEAVEMAIEECIKENVLSDFFRKNRSEVLKVSIFEYDEQRQMELARKGAIEEGREKGIKEGREKGIKEGREKGIKEGIREGKREGRQEGEKLFAALTDMLLGDGRIDDLKQAVHDERVRKLLYEEYDLGNNHYEAVLDTNLINQPE